MENSQLKLNAKSVLKTTYWMSFLGLLIVDIITYAVNSVVSSVQNIGAETDLGDYYELMEDGDFGGALEELSNATTTRNPVFVIIGYLLSIAVTLCVINIINVGVRKMFLRSRVTRKADIGDIFKGYSNFGGIFKTMFFYDLYIYLWSMLFLIPGIIKSYSYYMVPYILAENPNIDTSKAFEISKKTMDGEKGKCFYMHLSFLGWYLLAMLPCCLGIMFVNPYANATYAEFYAYVKQKALATGTATPADFGEVAA